MYSTLAYFETISGAQIVSKPEYVRNTTNNNVVLSCEAIGFPTPSIHWIVTKANDKTFALPGKKIDRLVYV